MTTDQGRAVVVRLFETYFDRVYRFVRRSSDPATAEEVAHEVFVRLLTRSDLASRAVSASYLIKIADNMLKRRFRRGERTREVLADLARAERGRGAIEAARLPPEADSVLRAFDRLSREEQDAVRLIVCEGLSYRAAATVLGVRVTTVNNWKHRGMERLRAEAGRTPGRCAGRDTRRSGDARRAMA